MAPKAICWRAPNVIYIDPLSSFVLSRAQRPPPRGTQCLRCRPISRLGPLCTAHLSPTHFSNPKTLTPTSTTFTYTLSHGQTIITLTLSQFSPFFHQSHSHSSTSHSHLAKSLPSLKPTLSPNIRAALGATVASSHPSSNIFNIKHIFEIFFSPTQVSTFISLVFLIN